MLLLQGPAGPFFRRVAGHLRRNGSTVTKVNFNSGEDLYYRGPDVIRYTGALEDWGDFFARLVEERQIQCVVLFGDCRPLHRTAIERARNLPCRIFVFEEGYLRPDFVTLEKDGVNGFSSIPRDPEFYRRIEPRPLPEPRPVQHGFAKSAWHTICYATTAGVLKHRYPRYRHHRDIRPLVQAGLWVRSAALRLVHTVRDREFDRRLEGQRLPPYFFVPLQVHLDSQLLHSRFRSMEEFIAEVVRSFAGNAPPDTLLVLKHHPMDRPYRDYSPTVDALRRELALGERLVYVDVINVPAALRGARGTVVMNSTVGLSSIHHGTPVKCLGNAVYDLPGLTSQRPLDEFWQNPGTVDRALYERFRYWLRTTNQLNGSVWCDLYDPRVLAPATPEAALAAGSEPTDSEPVRV